MWLKVIAVVAGFSTAGVLAFPAAAEPAGNYRSGSATGAPGAHAKKAEPTPKPYCSRYKCIALTFDDGPWPYTPALLDTLRRHKAKSTFFVLGRKVENRRELTQRIVQEGHEIGNHTWDHAELTGLTDDEILEELTSTSDIIEETIGKRPEMMRPPSGLTDERVREVAVRLGLPQILWTGSTLDWQARKVDVIAKRTLKLAKRDGVILLHDIVPETVKAMPTVLKTLEKQNYKFVTVTTLLRGKKLKPGEIYPRPSK